MKIAMLFPGFGSQFIGMCKELYDEHRIIQEYFEQASNCLDRNFVKLCFASSDAELRIAHNAHTSIFLVSTSIVGLLRQMEIYPDVVAGYNQGEYAALFAASGLSLPDGLYLLNKFAGFYREALEDMDVAAIDISGLSAEQLEDICVQANAYKAGENASIAFYKTANMQTVTGYTQAVERVRDLVSKLTELEKVDIDVADLAIGLHSPLMDPVIERFRIYLEKVDFHDLDVCMMESINGECIERGTRTRKQVIRRINSPVVWTSVMRALAPYDIMLEIGPGTQLSKWAHELYPEKTILAINKPEDVQALQKVLGQ